MKSLFTAGFLFITTFLQAQIDSVRKVEPGMETSYTNEDLLLLALAGLAVLLAVYFLFRRNRARNKRS